MRLWSFGDCDRRFPYVDTDTHKECVRVVGSPEARDARALRVCEVSNGTDREETERCKATYLANKEKAAQETLAASAPAAALPPPSPEVMRRVKAITTAAIEEQTGRRPGRGTSGCGGARAAAAGRRPGRVVVRIDHCRRVAGGRAGRPRGNRRAPETGPIRVDPS